MAGIKRIWKDLFGRAAEAVPTANGSSAAAIDPATLMKLKNLELRARAVVEGFMAGIHRSPWHGFSVEFSDYRQYSPGDDTRYLDWRLYARQDRYYVKRFEDETNLRCYLVADLSRSMDYGSLDYNKADYARTMLATFACFLSMQHDAAGLLTFDETVGEYIAPRYRPGHLRRLLIGLERATSGTGTGIGPSLEQVARLTRGRGLVVLASDMLAPIDDFSRKLGYLRSQGHEIMIVRILDPAELNFDFFDASIFEDTETGRELFVDPQMIARDYRQQFSEHADQLQQICRSQATQLVTITTDQPLSIGLVDFVRQRKRVSSRRSRRHASWARSSTGADS
jgi:uncharacterized protein (DUF58 family)